MSRSDRKTSPLLLLFASSQKNRSLRLRNFQRSVVVWVILLGAVFSIQTTIIFVKAFSGLAKARPATRCLLFRPSMALSSSLAPFFFSQSSLTKNEDSEEYTIDSLRTYAKDLVRICQGSKLCVFLAGGGSTAVSMLAATPGASSVLVEGRTTYDRHSYLNAIHLPDKATKGKSFSYGGVQAARLAARASLEQALKVVSMDDDLTNMIGTIGVGCASSLVSSSQNSPRGTGTVMAVSADGVGLSLTIEMKADRSRWEEELVFGHLVFKAVELLEAKAGQPFTQRLDHRPTEWYTAVGDKVTEAWEYDPTLGSFGMEAATSAASTNNNHHVVLGHESNMEDLVVEASQRVVDGGEDAVLLLPLYKDDKGPIGFRAVSQTVLPNKCLIFPGSFNPPHKGHLGLAKAAIQTLERLEPYVHPRRYNEKPILFELSLTNVDKPSIDPKIVAERLRAFLDLSATTDFPEQWGIVLTRAPLFEEKLKILRSKVLNLLEDGSPQVNFVIGTDTLVRILNPKYYKDQLPDNMIRSLLELKNLGAGFIVGGRLEQGTCGSPRFVSGKDELLELPEDVASLFSVMEESEFRVDLSSSELRRKQQQTK